MSAVASLASSPGLSRFRDFVASFAALLDGRSEEAEILRRGPPLLAALVAEDDWLPNAFAEPDPVRYRQYLLHRDSHDRFSVVSFVWGPGQATPLHDHRVWGMVGVLRGAELVEPYNRDEDGALAPSGPRVRLEAGEIDTFGPSLGDIHRVANAYADRVSISIHVYGADIGTVERATYDATGRPKRFVSGYANTILPDLWAVA